MDKVIQTKNVDKFIKVGAIMGLVGSLGAAIGNILHPSVPHHSEEAAHAIAHSAIWVPTHVFIAITIFMMVIGLAAFMKWLPEGMSKIWSQFGLIAAIIGATIGVALMASDGITAKYTSLAWLEADAGAAKVALLAVADMSEKISFGLVAMFNLFFAGVTFLFFGLATVMSRLKIAWTGYSMIAVGLASIVIGFVQASLGYSPSTIQMLTIVAPSLLTVWTAAMCIVMLRRPRFLK